MIFRNVATVLSLLSASSFYAVVAKEGGEQIDHRNLKKTKQSKKSKNTNNPEPLSKFEIAFGPQLTAEDIAERFTLLENKQIVTRGIQDLKPYGPYYSIVDYWSTSGTYGLTREEVNSICANKCVEQGDNCKAFSVQEEPNIKAIDGTSFSAFGNQFACFLLNPDLGPVFHNQREGWSIYSKGDKNILEPFVPSDVPTEDMMEAAFGCYITDGLADPDNCPQLIPPDGDYMKYMAPAFQCIGDLYGGFQFGQNTDAITAFQTCLGCLTTSTKTILNCATLAAYVCDKDGNNLVTDICKDSCPASCKSEIQTSLLCNAGDAKNQCITRGVFDLPPFTCPN